MKLIGLHFFVFAICLVTATAPSQTVDLLAGNGLENFVDANGKPVTRTGWTNSDGVLHHRKRGGNLFYKEPVGDFILSFEFKVATGGNSGIKYRVKKFGNSWLGCEFQVQDDKDRIHHRHATGSLYAVYEPSKSKKQYPAGEWNRGKIVVRGNRIEHWVNGVLVVDAETGSVDWNKRVERSKFKPYNGFGENEVGRIMIQDHGTEVWFRDMKLTLNSGYSGVDSVTGCDCSPSCTRFSRLRTRRLGFVRRRMRRSW